MPDAPPRRRVRAPVLFPTTHITSHPPLGFPHPIPPSRAPVRRNLFSSQLSSRMTSSQPSPDLPSFPPSASTHSHPPSTRNTSSRETSSRGRSDRSARDLFKYGRPRRMSDGSSTDEIGSEPETRQPPPKFIIPRDREEDMARQPQLPPPMPRMGRLDRPAPSGMRRPAVGRPRPRRSEEDEIVVRDAAGEYAVTDPIALITAGRRRIPHHHDGFTDEYEGTESDSEDEVAEEKRQVQINEAERKKIREAIKLHNREKSKPDAESAELLEVVKGRMRELMGRLEDDEWMFSAGEHK